MLVENLNAREVEPPTRRAFIHIGYPKAGSSALQTTFHASRPLLRQHGYFYPDALSGLCNAFTARFHHEPETLFPYCDMRIARPRLLHRMRNDFDRLERRVDAVTPAALVLSSESLIGLEEDAVEQARDWLLSRFGRATVVCYVRDPPSYASSLIQERVKQGQTLLQAQTPYPTGNFSGWIPRWVRAFGKDNVVVRSIYDLGAVEGDVARDFATLIGYTGPLRRSEQYHNERLSQAAVLLLDAINALDGPLNSKSPELMSLWSVPGPGFVLPPDFLDQVRSRAQGQIAYLEAEWGITFPSRRTDVPPPAQPFSDEVLRFLSGWIIGVLGERRP